MYLCILLARLLSNNLPPSSALQVHRLMAKGQHKGSPSPQAAPAASPKRKQPLQSTSQAAALDIEELFRKGNVTLLKKALKAGQLDTVQVRQPTRT